MLALKIHPGRISRKVEGIELTPEEYDQLQINAGVGLRTRLDAAVNAPGWSELPEFVRREIVEKAISSSRAQARKLAAMQPEFFKRKLEARQKDLKAKIGKGS